MCCRYAVAVSRLSSGVSNAHYYDQAATALSTLVLLGLLTASVLAGRAVATPVDTGALRIQIVGHQHHLFGWEVAEEGTWRYLRCLRDLLDGCVGVAVFLDEPHRFATDGLAGFDLLAVPQTENLISDPHWAIVSMTRS